VCRRGRLRVRVHAFPPRPDLCIQAPLGHRARRGARLADRTIDRDACTDGADDGYAVLQHPQPSRSLPPGGLQAARDAPRRGLGERLLDQRPARPARPARPDGRGRITRLTRHLRCRGRDGWARAHRPHGSDGLRRCDGTHRPSGADGSDRWQGTVWPSRSSGSNGREWPSGSARTDWWKWTRRCCWRDGACRTSRACGANWTCWTRRSRRPHWRCGRDRTARPPRAGRAKRCRRAHGPHRSWRRSRHDADGRRDK
jgi:hypothetical protein